MYHLFVTLNDVMMATDLLLKNNSTTMNNVSEVGRRYSIFCLTALDSIQDLLLKKSRTRQDAWILFPGSCEDKISSSWDFCQGTSIPDDLKELALNANSLIIKISPQKVKVFDLNNKRSRILSSDEILDLRRIFI